MALPRAKEARQFYQAAQQRFEDARFLFEAGRTTGAIYLAGYSVKCILKALILSRLPAGRRIAMLQSFYGSRAHDYNWLKARYFESGGLPFAKPIANAFAFVNTWAVEIRYRAGSSKHGTAKGFLNSAKDIMAWADGRM